MRLVAITRAQAALCLFFISLFGLPDVVVAQQQLAETSKQDKALSKRVAVLYATQRDRTGSDSLENYYGGARGVLHTGVCALVITPIPGLQGLADSLSFYIPDQRQTIDAISEFSETQFWDEIATRGSSDNIVVYVHGYNIGFEKSCQNAALFQQSLDLDGRLVLFSWPADGNVLNYTLDEADLEWSVGHMEHGLRQLVERLGPGLIDVVAHSLGSRGVVKALLRMACCQIADPLINQLVLVAPDIDTDIFQRDVPLLKQVARRITRYVSANDRALWLSEEVHGYPRLGQAGEDLRLMKGIETIDVSDVGSQRFSGHLYHLFNSRVMRDLELLLNFGESASERPGLERAEHDGKSYWRLLPDDLDAPAQ